MASSKQSSREARRKMMLEEPIAKVIPLIAFPMVVSMLIDSFYNLADTYFVSQLGTAATAAVGVNDSLMGLLRSVSFGIGMGASSYISRLLGAQKDEEACRAGNTAFFTAVGISAFLAVLGLIFTEPLVMLLGATETSKQYSMDYASFILIAAPFTAMDVVLSQLLRSEGSTTYSMIGMTSGCFINILLDPLFINVFKWGVGGAAAATALSKVISAVVLLYPYFKKKTLLDLSPRLFKPSKAIYAEIARMGIPSFLRSSLLNVSTVITNNIAGGFSDAALAAISVANKCTRFIGSAIIGFGQGFQPVAGYCWGAQDYRRVLKAFWFTTFLGASVSAVLGGAMIIFSEQLVGVFAADGETDIIAIGSYMVRAQCFMLPLHMWVMVISGLFQALGKATGAAVLSLSRQVICLIPCVIILSKIFGVYGLASAQAASDGLAMLIAAPMLIMVLREIKSLIRRQESELILNPSSGPEPSAE